MTHETRIPEVALLLGLMLSALAAVGVVMLWMPLFFLDPCRS